MNQRQSLWLLAAAIGIIYLQSLWFPFVALDDSKHIWQNPYVMNSNSSSWSMIWSAPYYGLYVPLVYSSWNLMAQLTQLIGFSNELTGISAFWFHFANVGLHFANAALVFFFFQLFIAAPYALFGALIFAIHPLQVEAVAWASGLKDTLSTFFALLCLNILSLKWTKSPRWWSSVHFIFALLSKPSVVTLPLAAGLRERILPSGTKKTKQRPKSHGVLMGLWLVLALAIVVKTRMAQPESQLEFSITMFDRVRVAIASIGFYIVHFFVPVNLAPEYGLTPPFYMQTGWFWRDLAVGIIFLSVLAISSRMKDKIGLFAGALVGLGLLPVLGLVHFAYQNFSTVADRYVYFLPMLGFSLFAARTCEWADLYRFKNKMYLIGVPFLILSLFQTAYWRDNEALFQQTIRVNPNSYLALSNLGLNRLRDERLSEAEEYFNKSLKAKPDYLAALSNLGVVYFRQKNYPKTISHYTQALTLKPDAAAGSPAVYGDMHFNLGAAYVNSGQVDLGVQHFKKAIEIYPDNFKAHFNLARVYLARGDRKSAEPHLKRAYMIQPNDRALQAELQKLGATIR